MQVAFFSGWSWLTAVWHPVCIHIWLSIIHVVKERAHMGCLNTQMLPACDFFRQQVDNTCLHRRGYRYSYVIGCEFVLVEWRKKKKKKAIDYSELMAVQPARSKRELGFSSPVTVTVQSLCQTNDRISITDGGKTWVGDVFIE